MYEEIVTSVHSVSEISSEFSILVAIQQGKKQYQKKSAARKLSNRVIWPKVIGNHERVYAQDGVVYLKMDVAKLVKVEFKK